jgi:DNA polymerase III subunit gamma/tau
LEIAQGTFIDVLEMDAASNRGIDEIRSLRENVRYTPAYGKYKVYIIDEVHMLTEASFNALLKTLEEPPAHVVFVMATTEAKKIPPTILSRCQRFYFRPLAPLEVKALLERIAEKEGVSIEEEALNLLARASNGSLRDGEMLLEQVLASAQSSVARDDVALLLGIVEAEVVEGVYSAIVEGNAPLVVNLLREHLINRGLDAYSLVEELSRKAQDELVRRVFEEEDQEVLFHHHTLEDLLLKLLDKMRRHPLPDVLAEMELVRMASLPRLLPVASLMEILDSWKSEMMPGAHGLKEKESVRRGGPGGLKGKDLSSVAQAGELDIKLRDFLAGKRPSLSPTLGKCRVYLAGGDLVLESRRLSEFEKESLEDEDTVRLIRLFMEEEKIEAKIKLKFDGEKVVDIDESEGHGTESEIIQDPRVQRTLGLFRGKVLGIKPLKEEEVESDSGDETGPEASDSHS